MNFGKPLSNYELGHCRRFCFNGGACTGCYRDAFGLAQCTGCVCPTNLWTGERCEVRVGTVGTVPTPAVADVLAWLFGIVALLLCALLITIYIHKKRNSKVQDSTTTEEGAF
ncbi:unnamed protein product [Dibothriocephalus latus]|uniref:EGF-like domain-containing protein n=1 Tax=Dibothriocephalus latus TaxID=60516 RepID=A0A3P6TEX8_DIBLA|nr:unnamed protein product [Dibothriocephalus latus]